MNTMNNRSPIMTFKVYEYSLGFLVVCGFSGVRSLLGSVRAWLSGPGKVL